MSDYSVLIKVRNGRIRRRMLECGFKTVGEMCRLTGLRATEVGEFLNLKESPLTQEGNWKKGVLALAEVLGCLPDDLFSKDQLVMKLKRNDTERFITQSEMVQLIANPDQVSALPAETDLEDEEDQRELRKILEENLPPRNLSIISDKYGLDTGEPMTLDQVGEKHGVSRERIRQIEGKALRALRHPERREKLEALARAEWLRNSR